MTETLETKTETRDPLFSISEKDAPELAAAKARFSAARGVARNDARVQLLVARLSALENHATMLTDRLYHAQADIADTRASLRYFAPDVAREIES